MAKRDIGGKDSVPRMLRMAFSAATEGEEEKAWSFWRSAIARGYKIKLSTQRQLEIEIDKGKRDRGVTPKLQGEIEN